MFPSPRPRSTRQALAGLQYALSTVASPNPLVLFWRWRYELILGIGLPVALIVLYGIPVMLGRAWCIITPHRVRVGCAQAWIHSRYGKIPIVLLTTRQPFGERVHLWCRAGTSAIDFTSAQLLLSTACWARDVRVNTNERYAQLITLDVIRRVLPDYPGDPELGYRTRPAPGPHTPPDSTDGGRTPPTWPSRRDVGPAA
jgi:hypothetical protein